MIRALRFTFCLVAGTAAAIGQIAGNPEPIVRTEPLRVQETRLAADSVGTTMLPIDSVALPPATTPDALGNRVANFHVNSGGAGSFGDLFTLRGLANTPYFSDPAVTVYFDDLPLGSSFTNPVTLFGFAQATLHRGPQASAFGRAGEAGVLVFSSIEPGANAAGELRAGAGSFRTRTAAVTARSARGTAADASLSAAFSERDGFIANTELGTRVDDAESASVSARIRVRPTGTSEVTLQFLGSRLRNGAQPLVPLGGPLFSVARGREGNTKVDFGGVALKAAFDTELGHLTATTSYTDWTLDPFTNRLVLPPPLDSSLAQSQRTWSEEIRLASADRTPLMWNLGAWFSDGKTAGNVERSIPGLFPIEVSSHEARSRTAALFGQTVLALDGGWRVTGGLRAEQVKKHFERSQSVPGPGHFAAAKTFRALLPKLAVSRALSASTTASASVSVGTKPGGWSAFTSEPALARFEAERTVACESGIETTLANNTVNLAARAFIYDIRDYQIERSFTPADYIVVNAPRARSIGGEIEAAWRPAPAWTLAATLGLADVTLRSFTDPFTGTDYAGKRAPYTPSYDANLSATYRDETGWFGGVELSLVGTIFYVESEDPAFAQDDRIVANARFGYEAARWRVSAYGENLTDEGYYATIIPGVGHGVPGAPRTWGIEAAVKW